MNNTATARVFLSPIEQQVTQRAKALLENVTSDLSERECHTTDDAQRFADEMFELATTIRIEATRLRRMFR